MSGRTGGRSRLGAGMLLVAVLALSGCTAGVASPSATPSVPSSEATAGASVDEALASDIRGTITARMADWGLRAVIVRATQGDQPIITEAFGESMTGVPATTDMHFRNSAVAISYVATASSSSSTTARSRSTTNSAPGFPTCRAPIA